MARIPGSPIYQAGSTPTISPNVIHVEHLFAGYDIPHTTSTHFPPNLAERDSVAWE